MDNRQKGQLTSDAAEVYEAFYIPALFQQWAERVADAIAIRPGQHVLDVACGTGIVARTVADRVVAGGSVIGIDTNEGMLGVAKRMAPEIEWRHGSAEALPFGDNSFDSVLCNFGLMYFEDRNLALAEMCRVLRPQGRLGVVVWDTLENTPAYDAVTNDLLSRIVGDELADGFRAPYVLGDLAVLRALLAEGGLSDVQIRTYEGTARFSSIRAWIETDVKGWVLSDTVDDALLERLLEEAEKSLQKYVTDDGTVAFSTPAHIATAAKA
jgi:SAM-dependent methyltransferase